MYHIRVFCIDSKRNDWVAIIKWNDLLFTNRSCDKKGVVIELLTNIGLLEVSYLSEKGS